MKFPSLISRSNTHHKQTNDAKAPGIDILSANIVKAAQHSQPTLLLEIFNKCLKLGTFPDFWKNGGNQNYTQTTLSSETHSSLQTHQFTSDIREMFRKTYH